MILKVEDSSYPYGWSYFNGVSTPSVSGRVPLIRIPDDDRTSIAFLSEEDERAPRFPSPRWAFDTLHWMVGPQEADDGPSWLAVQWRQGQDTHVLVTRRTAFLMSDDGKTVDRL